MSGANRARRLPRTVAPLGAETRTSKKIIIYTNVVSIYYYFYQLTLICYLYYYWYYIYLLLYIYLLYYIILLFIYIIIIFIYNYNIIYIIYNILYSRVAYFSVFVKYFFKKFLSPLYFPTGKRKIGSKPPIGPYALRAPSSIKRH